MVDVPEDRTDESSDEEFSDSEPIESLVAGRQRRGTAGNRYNKELLAAELEEAENEDEVNLLFAEDEAGGDDEDFRSDEAEDDDMSTSDDDDHGPNAAADDLEGENELKKKEKAEKSAKRKRDLALTTTTGLKKRARIDPTLPAKPISKPSKRKERVSWLPTHDTGKSRTSLRKQTVAHRELTIKRLEQSEAQRLKHKALKEQRDRKRDAQAPKALTQADRLAEAAKIERKNARSLNRWEESEKKRAEEQAAKLAALRERKLEGPVITFLSRKGVWVGPRRDQGGSEDGDASEVKKRGRRPKGLLDNPAAILPPVSQSFPATPQLPNVQRDSAQEAQVEKNAPVELPEVQITLSQPQAPKSFLQGIHEYASLQNLPATDVKTSGGTDTALSSTGINADLIMTDVQRPPPSSEDIEKSELIQSPPQLQDNADLQQNPDAAIMPPTESTINPQEPSAGVPPATTSVEAPSLPPVAPVIEHCTRNLVVFSDFDDLDDQSKHDYGFLNNKRSTKTTRSHQPARELCLLTNLPARYRDPSTGIAYANKEAYDKIRNLKQQRYSWSSMLGCYVGREGVVARGAPEGFLGI